MTHGADERKAFLEALETTPFIGLACKRVGISRATFYRWRDEDLDFRVAVKQALKLSRDILGEAAYSVVQKKVKEGYLPAARFVLTHYSSMYGVKSREEGTLRKEAEREAGEDWDNLTPEQRKKLAHQQLVKAFSDENGNITVSKETLKRIRAQANPNDQDTPPQDRGTGA